MLKTIVYDFLMSMLIYDDLPVVFVSDGTDQEEITLDDVEVQK